MLQRKYSIKGPINNHYKRMYVLSGDEYNRLKLQNQKAQVTIAPVEVAEEPTVSVASSNNVDQAPSPSATIVPNQFTCKICGKIYKQKRDLRRHAKLVHCIIPPIKAIIPINKVVKKKTKKKKKSEAVLFVKVKKWMTMRG